MRYYIVNDSFDEKIVGKDFPQAYKFIKGYNPDAPHALFSLYKYWESFPDYIPELDGVMLSGSAKLTDFVSDGFSSKFHIISAKAQAVFKQYHLCSHRLYPLGLYKRKIKYDYYLLYNVCSYLDYVDFEKSTFVLEYDMADGKAFEEISVDSKEELFEKRNEIEKEGGGGKSILGNRIVMNSFFNKELDFFRVRWIDVNLYVSERLKNAIEENGLTGWIFTPASNLVVE